MVVVKFLVFVSEVVSIFSKTLTWIIGGAKGYLCPTNSIIGGRVRRLPPKSTPMPLPTLLTFVVLPLALGALVTFARLSRASFMSHLLAPPSCRAGPSPWLALWYGMVSHWLSSHFLEYSPRNSFSNLKQHYSAALGLGALLSSPT